MKTYTGHRNERKVLWKVFNHEISPWLLEQKHLWTGASFSSILSWVHFLPLNQVFYRHSIYASWVVEQRGGREGWGVEVSIFFLFWPTLSSSERAVGVGSPGYFVQGFLLGSPSKIPAVHPAMTRAVTSPMFCKHRGSIPGLPQTLPSLPTLVSCWLVGLAMWGVQFEAPVYAGKCFTTKPHPWPPRVRSWENRGWHQGHLNSNGPGGSSLEHFPVKFRESQDSGRHEKIMSRKNWRKTTCLLPLTESLP